MFGTHLAQNTPPLVVRVPGSLGSTTHAFVTLGWSTGLAVFGVAIKAKAALTPAARERKFNKEVREAQRKSHERHQQVEGIIHFKTGQDQMEHFDSQIKARVLG